MIVNPVIAFTPFGGVRIAMTDMDLDRNKCPFLRADCKCNIYENRPNVCRKWEKSQNYLVSILRRANLDGDRDYLLSSSLV